MGPLKHVRGGWLAFLVPLALYLLTLGATSTNGVDASIAGSQYALWKTGSMSLGVPPDLIVGTVDYGVYGGRAYSAVAPGMAVLSYPFAYLAFAVSGGAALLGPVYLADEVFLALTASTAAFLVYRISRLYGSERVSLLTALATAFATPLWPFTTVVFSNAPGLMLSLASVYLALLSCREERRRGLAPAAGALLGLAMFVEYAAALFILPLALFIWRRSRGIRRPLAFTAASMAGPLLLLLYNYMLLGNPLVFTEQLKSGTSVPVTGLLTSFDLWSAPLHAAYYFVSPYRGILLLCPVLVAGLYAILRNLKAREMAGESLLFLSLFLLVLVFYSSWRDWAGGLGYGPRFLTIAVPYLLVPLVPLLRSKAMKGSPAVLLLAALAYSSFIQGAGALTTAFSVADGPSLFQPLALNLGWLSAGELDTWWVSKASLQGGAVADIFVVLAFGAVWVSYLILLGFIPKRKAYAGGEGGADAAGTTIPAMRSGPDGI